MRKLKTNLAVLVAATMLSSTPVWAKEKDNVELPNHVKETYEEVLELVPEIKEYKNKLLYIGSKNYTITIDKVKRGDLPSASITIDKNTGDMVSFLHSSKVEQSSNPPSDEEAKGKATEFLREVLDDKFADYKFDSIEKDRLYINNEDADGNEIDVERDVKKVLFTSQNDKALNLVVVVDTGGVIHSVEPVLTEANLDPKVRQSAKRLFEAIPELKEGPYQIKKYDDKASEVYEDPEGSLMDTTTYSKDNTNFEFDNITGELLHLYINEHRGKSNNPISKEVAKVKAAQFVQQVIEDSEKYKFVGHGTPYSEENDLGTTVGFTTPLPKHKGYVKHFRVLVTQNGEIKGVNTDVEKDSFDFEEYYEEMEKPRGDDKDKK